jgi:hypothetical protein
MRIGSVLALSARAARSRGACSRRGWWPPIGPWLLAAWLKGGQAGATEGVFAFADSGRAPFLANGYAGARVLPVAG